MSHHCCVPGPGERCSGIFPTGISSTAYSACKAGACALSRVGNCSPGGGGTFRAVCIVLNCNLSSLCIIFCCMCEINMFTLSRSLLMPIVLFSPQRSVHCACEQVGLYNTPAPNSWYQSVSSRHASQHCVYSCDDPPRQYTCRPTATR